MSKALDNSMLEEADSEHFQKESGILGRPFIKVYVEAFDDVVLWEKIFNEAKSLAGVNVDLEVSPIGDEASSDGKAKVLKQHPTAGPPLLLCVDSDYDFVAKGYREQSTLINENEFIFQTYCYSLENFLCDPDGLPALFTQASKRTALTEEVGYGETFTKIGEQILPPLLMMLYLLKVEADNFSFSGYSRRLTSSISFISATQDINKRIVQITADMSLLKLDLEQAFSADLDQPFNDWLQAVNAFFEGQWHLVVRGHDLLDKVVLPIAKQICNDRVSKKMQELAGRTGGDKAEKIQQYNESKVYPQILIENRVDFEKTVVYKHIIKDFTVFFQKHHAN